RDGKVAYIGDPHTIDKPLEEMVNNEYDMRVAIANYRSGAHAAALLPELDIALKTNNVKEAISIGKQVLYNFSYVKPNTYLVLSSSITGTKTTNDELLEIALIAAKRGVASTQFESPGFYDLLATAYAAKGDYIMAAATEKMAIIYSEGEMKESQMKKFSNYQSLIRE
ncbi:MAG: hypothetical protein Q8941_15520, partial [Bacteroidota bacterium]|nr:hypothetical protein [Bacteroidota bacterium]